MMSISSASNDVSTLWPVRQLRANKKCGICFSFDFNPWLTCIRKHALVNLHMGFISRPRQAFLVLLQIAKFLPVPETYSGHYFKFQGPYTETVEQTDSRPSVFWPRRYKNPGIRVEKDCTVSDTEPKTVHEQIIYAYGKTYCFFEHSMFS